MIQKTQEVKHACDGIGGMASLCVCYDWGIATGRCPSNDDDFEKARGTSYEVSTHLPRHNMLPDDRTRMLKSTNGDMNSVVSVTVATVLMCSWWLHFGIATSRNKVADVPNHSCFFRISAAPNDLDTL